MNKLIVIMVVLAVLANGDGGNDMKEIPFPSASNTAESGEIKANNTQPFNWWKSDLSALKAVDIIKAYIRPFLDNIISHPVKCAELSDNEKAFALLKQIYSKDEPLKKILSKDLLDRDGRQYNAVQVQGALEQMEGHITFVTLNRTTISALIEIWEKYPCSQAGAIALLEVSSLLNHAPGGLDIIYKDGKRQKALKEDINQIDVFIAINYPNSWQGELSVSRLSHSNNEELYSDTVINADMRWIQYVEDNNIVNNKYYQYWRRQNSVSLEKEFVNYDYGEVSHAYIRRCEEAAKKGLKENGKIPQEAIDNFNKHMEIEKRAQKLHPEVYTQDDILLNSRCRRIIKQYAPEHYQELPPEIEKDNKSTPK